VNINRDVARNLLVSIAVLAVVLPAAWLGTSFGKPIFLGVAGVAAAVVAIYVGIRHPLWYFFGLALVISTFPFGRVPGVNVPIWYLFAVGAAIAAFFHPRFARSTHPLEWAMLAYFVAVALAVVAAGDSLIGISLFARWSFPTLLFFALCRLAPEHAVRYGKIFTVGATANGAYGLFIITFDPGYKTLAYLKAFGYRPEVLGSRQAYTGDASTAINRLGGTWVEPNGAAMSLALAIALALLLFVGWRRVVLTGVLSVALVLTLSRASTFTVVAGVLIVLMFHPMTARARMWLLSTIAIAALGALSAEPIRRRFLSSFGSGDAGSSARADALRMFPDRMTGKWLVGSGWGRREFLDPAYSYVYNLPSNATLIVLYRSGLLAFIAFVVLAVLACVYAYKAVRSTSFPHAMFGAIFIGLCVVQMQLDHPIAGTPTGAMVYTQFLAFLVYVDRARRAALKEQPPPQAVPGTTELLTASR
jgi:hypothetical protein